MNPLKVIWLKLLRLVKPACRLPRSIGHDVKRRHQQVASNELEVERRDRICNPDKYRGKDL